MPNQKYLDKLHEQFPVDPLNPSKDSLLDSQELLSHVFSVIDGYATGDHVDLINIGTFTHDELDSVATEMLGSIVETIDITVDATGATELQLQGEGAIDLNVVTASGITTVDTTPALTVALTDGTTTVPQLNYVYLDGYLSLTNSTVGWPHTFHSPIAQVSKNCSWRIISLKY